MNLLDRIRGWWDKDTLERASEETRETPQERDVAEEDYEGRKDDASVGERLRTEGVDFERDSEAP